MLTQHDLEGYCLQISNRGTSQLQEDNLSAGTKPMLPIVGVPESRCRGLAQDRNLFCREAGFNHGSRSVTGVILSPNKTLQGMHDLQGWGEAPGPSRRAMHEAVFEAGWAAEVLLPHHRKVIAPEHHGRGREVLSLAWTYAHHERGPQIWGVKKAWDHVANCCTPPTVATLTAVGSPTADTLEPVSG